MKGVEAKAFEAVRGISFEVKQGEILGITGKNGSGKSTLLRALAHIFFCGMKVVLICMAILFHCWPLVLDSRMR